MTRLHALSALFAASLVLGGCATRPVNPPITQVDPTTGYRFETRLPSGEKKPNLVMLAFSGGGTRAAAFSYGVVEFLRRTEVVGPDGRTVRLLDAVDAISGVSGGSFTALAYGLYGDKLFTDYEQRFLKRDVQGEIISRVLSPTNWGTLGSTGTGRSEIAAQLYDEILFNGATFGDLRRGKGPLIMASATDISTGSRFVFNQRVFDVICSDLDAVPLSRAAAASSAVPVVLSPVTFNNYGGTCNSSPPNWMLPFLDADNPPRPAARAIRSIKAEQAFSDSAHRALPPSRGWRRVGQRGHARRARWVASHRSIARSRHAIAVRRQAQDHRLHRQFAVFAADQLGRGGEPARHRGRAAQGGRRADRRLFIRGGGTAEGHRGALADAAPGPGFGGDVRQQGSCDCCCAARPRPRDLCHRRVVSRTEGQSGIRLSESAAHVVRVASRGGRSTKEGGGDDHHGFAGIQAPIEGRRRQSCSDAIGYG